MITYWTPAADAQLLTMIAAGYTNREIAAALGRTIPGVKQRRLHIGAPASEQNRRRSTGRPRTRIAALVAAIEEETVPALKRRLREQLVMAVWRRRVVGP